MKLDVPNFASYMESRIQTNECLKGIEYAKLIDESPAYMITYPLLDQDEFEKTLANGDIEVDKKIKLEMLDVAQVFHYNDEL